METKIKIKNRIIGYDSSSLIVAELSGNHLHNFGLAVETIKAMKKSGADAVKLQTYTPDTITIDCDNDYFKIKHGTIWDGKTFYELYKEAYMPWEWQPELKKISEDMGLILFSTPFDRTSVDFLERMEVPCYKIASFEITDIPLIEYVASKGKPVLISTGIASKSDIKEAINACRRMGNRKVMLLKCTSSYPAPYEEMNLRTITDMIKRFKCIVGLSDHSPGISVPIAAVAMNAKVIEKHFILDRKIGGPDAAFSLEPDEFKQMVESVRDVEKSLGKVSYELTERVLKNRKYSRSLFAVKDIKKGEIYTQDNIRSIRPGYGLSPNYLKSILGKKAKIDIKKGTPLSRKMI
jgi:pseudaminic acid synthase